MKRHLSPLLLAAALTAAGAAACNPTGGTPIESILVLEGLGDGRVTTPTGWAVALEAAVVLVGPIYAYAPIDAERAALPRMLSVARAHGGFDALEGRLVRAEYLDQVAFDALGAPLEVGPVAAFAGAVDELSLVLDAPRGAAADPSGPTRGHTLWVRGVARREGEEVAFEGGLDLPEEGLSRRVDGVVVEGGPLAAGSRLVVGVDADAWLAEADFTGVEGALGPESQPHRAWELGARSAASYAARIEGGETE
jgi:hypothetical protein